MTLQEKLGNRVVKKVVVNANAQYYIAKCPTSGCNNTCKVEKSKDLTRTCKPCAYKRQSKPKSEKHGLISTKRDKYNKPIYVFLCKRCKSETQSNTHLCFKCANLAKRAKPFERTYNRLIQASVKRGLTCTLTYDEFNQLCQLPNCEYCNKPLNRAVYKSENGSDATLLDRKDSSLGYSKSNCVPCCWSCNDIKGKHFNYQQFKLVIKILQDTTVGPGVIL